MLRLQVARRRHIIAIIAARSLPSLSPTSSVLNHIPYCHTNYDNVARTRQSSVAGSMPLSELTLASFLIVQKYRFLHSIDVNFL